MSFALSNFRVSKPLELNPQDNQGVRFVLHDLDEGLSWKESAARGEERVQMWEGRKHEKHEDTKGNTKGTKDTKGAMEGSRDGG